MTQISSFGPTREFGESTASASTGVAAWLLSKVRQPDVIVVIGFSAIGLALMIVAALTLPGFSSSLAEASAIVGP
jgi:hypothetical protein